MAPATDWDGYYQRPFAAASLTRKITTARLLQNIQSVASGGIGSIFEWGGANSCFVDALYAALQPQRYTVADNNRLGLELLQRRALRHPGLTALPDDVLHPSGQAQADLVFSVGLIEHFDRQGTAQAIRSHFDCARPGGLVLISFPTPTWLYRLTRALAERLGCWRFPDERALRFDEVLPEMQRYGECLRQDLIWPIVLTQGMLVFCKHGPERLVPSL